MVFYPSVLLTTYRCEEKLRVVALQLHRLLDILCAYPRTCVHACMHACTKQQTAGRLHTAMPPRCYRDDRSQDCFSGSLLKQPKRRYGQKTLQLAWHVFTRFHDSSLPRASFICAYCSSRYFVDTHYLVLGNLTKAGTNKLENMKYEYGQKLTYTPRGRNTTLKILNAIWGENSLKLCTE